MNRSVLGDLAQSSSIEQVEEYQENIRALKQEIKEHEQTWNELATARSLCVVFRTDLGGKSRIGALW
jgi:DNA repair exonuclease SbcCD ATPase subunit